MKKILLALLFTLSFSQLFSQGCSDAGFCTMGAMRPDQNYNKKINLKLRTVEYNFYRGKTTSTAVIYAHTLEFNTSLNEKNTIQFKVPYTLVSGNLGNNRGLGDISVSYTRNLKTFNGWIMSGTLGFKVPTNNANDQFSSNFSSNEEVPLPMYYQVSLGSFDLVAGASWISENWLLATGIQIALTENNNNFAISDWSSYPNQNYLQTYDEGKDLKRGIDVMLRIERNFRFVNYNFSIGLLPIYRITRDEVFLPEQNQRVKLPGTTGLALSTLASFGYNLNVKNQLKAIYGYKITDRKTNPDGLTRDNVLSVSYIYKF
ncbi:MAG: hypothetical protein WBA74_07855 [Cyclobacteriaceae bacterium]